MNESEFLSISREMLDILTKGTELCREIQSDLNDRYRDGLISYGEWVRETKENDRKKAIFREQLDLFWEKADDMGKV